jgi:lycopene cyclase domain-containing protein
MKWEYLIFNLVVVAGPLSLSFIKSVCYFKKWKYALYAIVPVFIPFILWDALVTGRHWWFNTEYISGLYFLGLPIEECMFFISVPFSVLFIWEIFAVKTRNRISNHLKKVKFLFLILPAIGVIFWLTGKEYTALVLVALGIVGLVDWLLKTEILSRPNTYIYLIIILLLNLIFNGYLTARPVVLYDADYQLDFRVFTIPIEDIFYGFALLLLNTSIYEKIIGIRNAR